MTDIEIKDGGEKTVQCSSCQKPLMHFRTYATSNKKTDFVATCPFCGDESFRHSVVGEFWYGPIGQDEKATTTMIKDVPTEIIGPNHFFAKFMIGK